MYSIYILNILIETDIYPNINNIIPNITISHLHKIQYVLLCIIYNHALEE